MFPTERLIWLPLFLLLALVTALAVGLWLSALNVEYRDVRYTVPFLTQFWMFATPIVYPSSLLSEPWRTIYGLNPMVGVVEGFRWALLGTKTAPGPDDRRLGGRLGPAARGRGFLLPAHGKDFRGRGVTNGIGARAIRVERLGKTYRLGERKAKYKSLRDLLAESLKAPVEGARALLGGRKAAKRARGDDLGAARRLLRDRPRARSSASSAATAPARARS